MNFPTQLIHSFLKKVFLQTFFIHSNFHCPIYILTGLFFPAIAMIVLRCASPPVVSLTYRFCLVVVCHNQTQGSRLLPKLNLFITTTELKLDFREPVPPSLHLSTLHIMVKAIVHSFMLANSYYFVFYLGVAGLTVKVRLNKIYFSIPPVIQQNNISFGSKMTCVLTLDFLMHLD